MPIWKETEPRLRICEAKLEFLLMGITEEPLAVAYEAKPGDVIKTEEPLSVSYEVKPGDVVVAYEPLSVSYEVSAS